MIRIRMRSVHTHLAKLLAETGVRGKCGLTVAGLHCFKVGQYNLKYGFWSVPPITARWQLRRNVAMRFSLPSSRMGRLYCPSFQTNWPDMTVDACTGILPMGESRQYLGMHGLECRKHKAWDFLKQYLHIFWSLCFVQCGKAAMLTYANIWWPCVGKSHTKSGCLNLHNTLVGVHEKSLDSQN